ncbi:MAG: fibronectin type III domain-containing protein [bacterium]
MIKFCTYKYSRFLIFSTFLFLFSGIVKPIFSNTEIQLKWDAATGSVVISWNSNTEADLAGYKVYYGTESGNYSKVENAGNTELYSISNLVAGQTYYFAVTAYDESGNESDFSTEVPFEVKDTEGPEIVSVFCFKNDLVVVEFNEKLDTVSAQMASNYSINNEIVVQSAEPQPDEKTVHLKTLVHELGEYVLTVTGVKDVASPSNTIDSEHNQRAYSWDGEDTTPPYLLAHNIIDKDLISLTFSEPLSISTVNDYSNYEFKPPLNIYDISRNDSCTLIFLGTENHTLGENYTLTISNLRDVAGNFMSPDTVGYTMNSGDIDAPRVIAARIQESRTELIVDFSERVEKSSAEDIANYEISPSVDINSATLETSQQSVILSTAEHNAGEYTVYVSNISDIAVPPNVLISDYCSYKVVFDTTSPNLDTLNVKTKETLELRFSERLDETTAQDITNYSISPSLGIQEAMLDVSQQIVTLYTQAHSSNNYQLSISGVTDIASNNIDPVIVDYSYEEPDRLPPRLSGVILHGLDMVELIFNESLERNTAENISNYSIDKNIVIYGAALTGDSLNHVYLSTSEHSSGDNYTITIDNVTDASPLHNPIESVTELYECPLIDNTAPRLVSADLQGFSFLILKFSEVIDGSTYQDTSQYSIQPSLKVTNVSLDKFEKIIYLTTENHQLGEDYTITIQGIRDKAGNEIGTDNQKSYSCKSTDNQPPALINAEALSNATVELKFNEALELSSAMNISNYAIDNGIEIKKLRVQNSKQYVTLTTSPHLSGTYSITVNNLKDLAGNTMQFPDQRSYKYIPEDNTPPKISNAKVRNEQIVEVIFTEPIHYETAENKDNYMINNGISVLSAKLDVHMMSVMLQTTKHKRGDYVLSVKNITDIHNNEIESNTIWDYEYAPEDNEGPYIVKAELENSQKLSVTFNEDLDLTTAMNDSNYAINNNITIKGVLSYLSNTVTLETSEHNPGTYTLTVNGIRDASENKNLIHAYSQKEYNWSPIDTTAPCLLDAELNNQYNLKLIFSEPLREEEAQNINNYSITPDVDISGAHLLSSFKEVNLITKKHESGKYRVTVENVYDQAFNPNKIGKNNFKEYLCSPPDTAAPDLATSPIMNNSSMLVILIFDEEITRKSAENIDNYSIFPDIIIDGAFLLSDYKTVHLETSSHKIGQNYSIEIRNIEDRTPSINKLTQPIKREYNFRPPDIDPPVLSFAKLRETNRLELVFNEIIDKQSAESRGNYRIKSVNQEHYIEIFDATLDTSTLKKVYLQTSDHMPDISYKVCAENIKDRALNIIDPGEWKEYSMESPQSTSNQTKPKVARMDVISQQRLQVLFTKTINKETAEDCSNYSINNNINIKSAKLDTTGLRVELQTSEHNIGNPYAVNVSNIYDNSSQHNELDSKGPVKYILGKNGVSMNSLSKEDYEWNITAIGEKTYVDRDYTIKQIPQFLHGAIQIKTRNHDKQDSSSAFLSFEIRGDATVYLAYDKRVAQKPEWLEEWEITGDQLVNSRDAVYRIYSKKVSTQRCTIEGNMGSMDDNMYLVFIKPHFAKKRILLDLNRASYSVNYVTVGDRCYIDREYTVAYIPDSLRNLLWIQTANDDRTEREDDFLEFTLKCSSNVYIGFDADNPSLPRWLNNSKWEHYNEQITDSRGSQFDIYFTQKDSGSVTLGGNCGGPNDNMYFVIIEPLEDIGAIQDSRVPGYFTLRQNYPNPFNPSTEIPITKIEYTIEKGNKQKNKVTLKIYNILGQLVKDFNLSALDMRVGNHSVTWDGTDYRGIPVASGVYFYTIQQGSYATTEKMLLLR